MHSPYPPDVERLNVFTHSLGIFYGVLTTIWILPKARIAGEDALIGSMVFLAGFILTFSTSTLYHAIKDVQLKWLMRRADHICIFFMIAGSYTPFILLYYKNKTGLTLLTIMWVLTLLGTVFKAFATGKYPNLSITIYVLMGAAILWISQSFFPLLPLQVTSLILAGGLSYLIGVFFYRKKSWKYSHPIWHLFVLGGALSHWWALWYALG